MTAEKPRIHVIRLEISEKIAQAYEKQAQTYGVPVEDVISDRVRECVNYTASRPIYLDDKDRQRLEKMTGRNFRNSEDVITAFETAAALKVGEWTITLPEPFIRRLKASCPKAFVPDQWIPAQILKWIGAQIGL